MESTIVQVNFGNCSISVKSQTYQHVTVFIKLNYHAQVVKKPVLWFPVLLFNILRFAIMSGFSMNVLLIVQWVCLCL